jgi:predicted metal-dependent phosphoesterase TrpH
VALRRIKADLHVHTCLSPCSGLDMSPREVISAAVRNGIELIGICDHNSAENVLAVKKAGERNGVMGWHSRSMSTGICRAGTMSAISGCR